MDRLTELDELEKERYKRNVQGRRNIIFQQDFFVNDALKDRLEIEAALAEVPDDIKIQSVKWAAALKIYKSDRHKFSVYSSLRSRWRDSLSENNNNTKWWGINTLISKHNQRLSAKSTSIPRPPKDPRMEEKGIHWGMIMGSVNNSFEIELNVPQGVRCNTTFWDEENNVLGWFDRVGQALVSEGICYVVNYDMNGGEVAPGDSSTEVAYTEFLDANRETLGTILKPEPRVRIEEDDVL